MARPLAADLMVALTDDPKTADVVATLTPLLGPQGPQGVAGADGPQGPQGVAGGGTTVAFASFAMLTPTDPVASGSFFIVGDDTDPWVAQSAPLGSIISCDGQTFTISDEGVIVLKFSLQMSEPGTLAQLRASSGAATIGGNFTGWLSGDPDPLTAGVSPGWDGDQAFDWLWHVDDAASFDLAFMQVDSIGGAQHFDGFEVDIAWWSA